VFEEKGEPFSFAITTCFGSTNPYKKNDKTQQMFFEDLMFYIHKGCKAFSTIENIWLKNNNFMPMSFDFLSMLDCSCE